MRQTLSHLYRCTLINDNHFNTIRQTINTHRQKKALVLKYYYKTRIHTLISRPRAHTSHYCHRLLWQGRILLWLIILLCCDYYHDKNAFLSCTPFLDDKLTAPMGHYGELIAYLNIDANSSCTNQTKPETPRCQQKQQC